MYKKKVLPNGFRLVSVPMKGTRAVTILVLVKTGSKYERKEISGVSHFLEHMFFKGSKRFPNVRSITEALDRIGAEYNAFTDTEATGFWVKVAADNVEKAVAIVGDMLRTPRFPKAEVERERGVILEELNLYFDSPARFVGDLWQKVLYGDQPAGRYVGGTPATVRAINHRHIVEHFHTYYRAPAMLVALSGALSNAEAFRVATKHFQRVHSGKTPDHLSIREVQDRPRTLIHYKRTDQTHLAVGFRGVSLRHPMRHAIAVLATILGGTMSSRLFLVIRDQLGLAYSIHTGADFDTESGSLVTVAGVRNDQAQKALSAILNEYKKLSRTAPPASEVSKAKEAMIGRFVLGLEQTDELAGYIASQELLLNRIRLPEEEVRSIRKVTPKDVQEAAKFLFRAEHLNLAMIGPHREQRPWYNQLRKAFPKK